MESGLGSPQYYFFLLHTGLGLLNEVFDGLGEKNFFADGTSLPNDLSKTKDWVLQKKIAFNPDPTKQRQTGKIKNHSYPPLVSNNSYVNNLHPRC